MARHTEAFRKATSDRIKRMWADPVKAEEMKRKIRETVKVSNHKKRGTPTLKNESKWKRTAE